MNVYQISVEPKANQGAAQSMGVYGNARTFQVVTDTLQDAMSIARGQISDKEVITGIYVSGQDVIVDYSKVIGQNI